MSRVFFDSNVLLYAINRDDLRGVKAAELLLDGGAISVQCLNEFASVARRKLRWSWRQIEEAIGKIVTLCSPIVPIDWDLHQSGLYLAERYQLSVYDGMIVAAALAAGCETLYSEDMHAGLVVEGQLTIVNPFTSPSAHNPNRPAR